jgi:hypothetical protein
LDSRVVELGQVFRGHFGRHDGQHRPKHCQSLLTAQGRCPYLPFRCDRIAEGRLCSSTAESRSAQIDSDGAVAAPHCCTASMAEVNVPSRSC